MKMFAFFLFILLMTLSLVSCNQLSEIVNTDPPQPDQEQTQTENPLPQPSTNQTRSINDLQLGDRIMDPTWTWEFRIDHNYQARENDTTHPIIWIIVAKNHYGESKVTLLSEHLIGYFPYDTTTLEPSGLLAGWGHWGDSGTGNANQGIRPWLNSTGIHSDEGFYKAFSNDFKSILVSTEVPNREYEDGEPYTTNDWVFIPSSTELGDLAHTETYEIGSIWPYFLGADNDFRSTKIMDDHFNRNYWLRNPSTRGYRPVGIVYEHGFFTSEFADFHGTCIRPVVNIGSSATVNAQPNEQGIYIIQYD